MTRKINHSDAVQEHADPAITSREAAAILGVSITTAQAWMESGLLDSWKTPGGHRRTRKSAVVEFLEKIRRAEPVGSQAGHLRHPCLDNECERAFKVEQTVLADDAHRAFDRITSLATQLLDVPIALISFLTEEHQLFKSKQGVALPQTPRSWAFCNYTIMQDEVFTVSDATKDRRFRNNPLVTDIPHIRFYAGMRLMYEDIAFGSLCVIDREPRILRAKEQSTLQTLAFVANDVLRLKVIETGLSTRSNTAL